MVLLYGIPGDGPFELVADALETAAIPFVILNPRQFEEFDFILHVNNDLVQGEISLGAQSFSLENFTGIYNRALDFSLLPEAQSLQTNGDEYQRYAKMFELFHQWIETANCRVVNKASAMSSNASKPYQLSLIAPFFSIPETGITNSPAIANAFQQTQEAVIYKSASGVRSIVQTIDAGAHHNYQNIRHCATLFQQQLKGVNYRVHVINEQLFAVKAQSETVDYRYSSREGKETVLEVADLPADVAEKCTRLAQLLKLSFAGIDLFLTEAGEWYCFEVNPSPGFSYFETHTGQPIAKTVAEYLAGR